MKVKVHNPSNLPLIDYRSLEPFQGSLKDLPQDRSNKLLNSLQRHGFFVPLFVWYFGDKRYLLDGHQRQRVMLEHEVSGEDGSFEFPHVRIDANGITDAKEKLLAITSQYGVITQEGFNQFTSDLDLSIVVDTVAFDNPLSFTPETISDEVQQHGSLADRFIVPPFSVLDTRQGYWQERKRQWISLGIESELGRDEGLIYAQSAQPPSIYSLRNSMRDQLGRDPSWDEIIAEAERRGMSTQKGTSIFDPVLCELMYRWFCIPGGSVIDPFAGGSVRGIVAALLGMEYIGIDLRKEQVEANEKQWGDNKWNIADLHCPKWIVGDSTQIDQLIINREQFDLIFSCPPYGDLEQYSDNPEDLSNMNWIGFQNAYEAIIRRSLALLKQDRFAVFVVGNFRDDKGFYNDLVGLTVECFKRNGAYFYNELALITSVASLAIRAGKSFTASRKVGKMHQNVLVFYKGDPKNIRNNYPAFNPEDLFTDEPER